MGSDRFELVTIGGQTFSLPSSYLDSDRRKQYFALFESDTKFMQEEKDVLKTFCGSETGSATASATASATVSATASATASAMASESPSESKKPTTEEPETNKVTNEEPAETKKLLTEESEEPTTNNLTTEDPTETNKTTEFKESNNEKPANNKTPKERPYLKDEEKKILCAIGFDYELLKQLCPYLAEFFDSLPSCSTDTAMLLKKDCETAYFVLWSVMFAAQNALQQRLKTQPPSAFLADIQAGIAKQTTTSLFDLHKQEDVGFDVEILKQLFTLGFGIEDIASFSETDIKGLFTISRKSLSEEAAIRGLLTF